MALRSPDDPNDKIYEHIACDGDFYRSPVPPRFLVATPGLPPRNQKSRGTCAAFAAASIKEIHEYANNHDNILSGYMSPEFIYYHRPNKPARGMFGRDVFKILCTIGTVPESEYPYRRDELASLPSNELYDIAACYRIADYARVQTIAGLKKALLEIGPCFILLPVKDRTRAEFWTGPGEAEEGHALAVVGYDESGFVLRNSWGPRWNGDGHVVFGYDDWAVKWECWVAIDEKNQKATLDDVSGEEPNCCFGLLRRVL
jgi:hypothetical protein